MGFLHTDRPEELPLALDLMEELRPHFADRFVLSLINRNEITQSDFEFQSSGAVYLNVQSRKKFLSSWQKIVKKNKSHIHFERKNRMGTSSILSGAIVGKNNSW